MRIKKLELVGFKSFKDRTVIQFDAGITGIVGPNGCGKSNIIDALTWVMGEQSAKHLRGASMEDVIFGGAEGYAPGGMAEVSLVLENDGGPFPAKYVNYSEVQVTRRLHRSGESEYLINKEAARLRDIQEIFMDTGAGSKGFSIVEQGAIGKIITAKPDDRRVMIEEAAGITKFKARKRESQKKLEQTDQNLLRLNDIVGELKRQLDSLQRQAKRAERYREIKKRIEELDLWISSTNYLELKNTAESSKVLFENIEAQEIETKTRLSQLDSSTQELRLGALEREKQLDECQHRFQSIRDLTQKKESELQSLKFEVEQASRNAQMQGSLRAETTKRQELLTQQYDEVEVKFREAAEIAASLKEEWEQAKQEFDSSNEEMTRADEELTQKRRELVTAQQGETQVSVQLEGVEQRREEIAERLERAEAVYTELQSRTQEFETRRNALKLELEKAQQDQSAAIQTVSEYEYKKKEYLARLEKNKSEVEEFKDRLNEVASRLYGLENLQAGFEGFEEGVKNILLWNKKRQTQLHADGSSSDSEVTEFRPLSDVMNVPAQFELAMEAALGARIQALVNPDVNETLRAVDYLKDSRSGRSSFLISSEFQGSNSENPVGDGVLAILNEVIETDESYRSKIHQVLNRVAVVDSISTAIRQSKLFPLWTFVTKDGDSLTSDGVLTGGSNDKMESGLLKRRREIRELSELKAEWGGKLALAQLALTKVQEELALTQTSLDATIKAKSELDLTVFEKRKDHERSITEIQNLDLALTRQNSEVEMIRNQLSQNQARYSELSFRLEELKAQAGELEGDVEALTIDFNSARDRMNEARESSTSLQVKWATRNQEAEGLGQQEALFKKQLDEVNYQLSRMEKDYQENTELLSTSQVLLEEQKIELDQLILKTQQAAAELSTTKNEFEIEAARARECESEIQELRAKQMELQLQMNEAKLKFEQAMLKEQNLVEQVRERYMLLLPEVFEKYVRLDIMNAGKSKNKGSLEIESDEERSLKDLEEGANEQETVVEVSGDKVIPFPNYSKEEKELLFAQAQEELNDLREKLKKIGDVNLSAIQEYEDTSSRYEFLAKQQTDLVDAKENLRKVIDRINRICHKRFKETFIAVNERFSKVFPVLFGGGEAHLTLIEDTEKGEMGIDIIARPPGKKLQSVTLMSGGEKALTAVSLIFAIFLVKPSPFCLLDEVDAPLDDANVARFNDLVREMAKRSQIIVITHNKATMEINERLYGVTMEERGVSKMVSVDLKSAVGVAGR